ncbi:MAG: methionine--tRNA ligase [Patescibacteria group bacterium]
MHKNAFYLTTTLPYVNAEPHIGFALEIVHADIAARYHKLHGDDVFFNTGTDEHGLKIYRKALEEGKDPQKYVDEYAEKFRALKGKLNLYPDLHFIRTTDANHKAAAQEFWRRCLKKGDIYKKDYQIKYCVGCELEKTVSELVDGRCPIHQNLEIELINEENYFFRWSKYQKELLLLYEKHPELVVPDFRFNEIKKFVEAGLEDFSISRLKKKMPWGVSVPNDAEHVMFVWFDALINYISTLGWPNDEANFTKFWGTVERPNGVQMAGKDQIRQQAAMWQAMLMSAGLPPSKQILIHGFINVGGQKMSKSLGNVIDPIAIVDEYGADALRYYLARHIHPFEDSDFTMEKFKEAYNAHLANGLGNVVRRILTLTRAHDVQLKWHERKNFKENIEGPDRFYQDFSYNMSRFRHDLALERIWNPENLNDHTTAIGWMNSYMQQEKPFNMVKTNLSQARNVMEILLRDLWDVSVLLEPFMPATSFAVRDAIQGKGEIPMLFPRKE